LHLTGLRLRSISPAWGSSATRSEEIQELLKRIETPKLLDVLMDVPQRLGA